MVNPMFQDWKDTQPANHSFSIYAEEIRTQSGDVNSASNGLLPGVHSDVGGGYTATSSEDSLQILDLDRAFGLSDQNEARFVRERQ